MISRHRQTLLGVLTLLVAALVPVAFIVGAGRNPLSAFAALLGYTLATPYGFAEVVVHAIPLTLLGLAVAVAFRANIFNIGGDGQLIVGAILGVAAAGWLDQMPAPAAQLGFLFVGFIGGAVLGAFVGWLRAFFGANEIIVTIMLNYVAVQLLTWVIRGPLQEPMRLFPRSFELPDSLQLPVLVSGTRVHDGLLLALAATGLCYLVLRHTAFGFRLLVIGHNPSAAPFAGIDHARTVVLAMVLSGGLAGLAGAVEIAGVYHRLLDDFAPEYGLAAIAVALLARLNPLFVPLTAILFGVFYVGAGAMQRDAGIPFPIVWIIEGVVILALLALGELRWRRLPATA